MKESSIAWLKWNFNQYKSIQTKSFSIIPENIMNELQEELSKIPEYENIRNLIVCLVNNIELKKCKYCGKTLKYSKSFTGHKKEYCSRSCASNSNEIKNKIKQTNIKKFGFDNPSKNEKIIKKRKQTCLKKYGTTNPSKNNLIKEKIKQTNLKKYNNTCCLLNKQIKEKSKKTCLKKYGVEYSTQSLEIKQKIKQTNINTYGVSNPSQSNEIKNKIKNQVFKKEFIKLKQRCKDYVIPLFDIDDYNGQDKTYKWKCVKCCNIFEQKIYTTNFNKEYWGMPRCLNCFPIDKSYSNLQKEVLDFIKSIYHGQILENNKTIIKPYELDIYLPEKRFAIEFDGIYWHNEENKPKNYHLMKTELCNGKNIHLIHIFEDEWLYKQDIVKDRIKYLLGIYDKKIYARKCIVKEISIQQKNEFLEQNHLQGKDNSSIKLGLFYENELVSVMTFGKPRFNKHFNYELLRFASKIGYKVIGGASRLLESFKRQYKGSIISYADRRYSNGKLYKAIGFKLIGKSQPNYFYVKGTQKLSRYQCQKYKLKKLLNNKFNKNLSQEENMMINHYHKIYDCGNLVYLIKVE